ncbi:MAG TPA: hypothetical protein VK427_04795 [Kofleriaceae bacterium]|nr:hypothetical protein [Kofleriaceae bacterium]
MIDNARSPKSLALLLAVLAAAALAYACVSTSWLYNPRNKQHFDVGFGLLSNYECELGVPDGCRSMSNAGLVEDWRQQLAEIKQRSSTVPSDISFAVQAREELRASNAFPVLGWITLVCCAIAALSLLVCAALVAANKRIMWPVMPTTTAILGIAVGLVAGCVFVAMKPGPAGYVGVHLGFFAFGTGVIVGIVAALLLNKLLRPYDEDLLADAMQPDQY